MQPPVRIIVSLVLLTSALASYHSSTKLRRDGVLNLYPFPRVGRASRNSWQVPINDYFADSEPVEKRQLYAFPRVGRSELLLKEPLHRDFQRARRIDSPGMWFGPRLGRSFKREEDGFNRVEQPLREPMLRADSTGPGMWFGPRVGRAYKSDEDDITTQNENIDHSEPEPMESTHDERERSDKLN